jgi:hypothetical protein
MPSRKLYTKTRQVKHKLSQTCTHQFGAMKTHPLLRSFVQKTLLNLRSAHVSMAGRSAERQRPNTDYSAKRTIIHTHIMTCGYLYTGPTCEGTYAGEIGPDYDIFQGCYIALTFVICLYTAVLTTILFRAKGCGIGMVHIDYQRNIL